MTQHIDKSALVSELKRRIQESLDAGGATRGVYLSERMKEDINILSFMDTHELKGVDFETAFAASIDHFDEKNNYGKWSESDLRQFAEHFFELGLKYQKGK